MKLLIIVPHPDDEVYGAAGTIMDHVQAGQTVGLLTLTRGEAGRTLGLAENAEELARIRQGELRECLTVLGLQVHEHLSYPDKYLNTVDLQELIGVARSALERHRPEVLLTFPPNGSNGHPDHVTTHRAVRAAWDSLPAGQRPELWYYASDVAPENPALVGEWLPANLRRDVTHHITRKLQAISCHRTQALSTVDFIRKFPERVTSETFYRVGGE
jgi:N-acetylglucosamine malate deacetylase 2